MGAQVAFLVAIDLDVLRILLAVVFVAVASVPVSVPVPVAMPVPVVCSGDAGHQGQAGRERQCGKTREAAVARIEARHFSLPKPLESRARAPIELWCPEGLGERLRIRHLTGAKLSL